ncbi:MAG: antibiotic biosynthesis monooxygenase [Clostridiales Family XIII bacterium]|nr:antibiotic biosynthesis monooxygenase [Clostridiales Family XIII bacterium]
MIIANVLYKIKPGQRNAFLAACREIGLLENTHKEKGNIAYDHYLPVHDENAVFCAELWEDADAFTAHRSAPHVVKFQDVKKRYVADADLSVFEGARKE